jgi:hypothetical protein
MARTEEPISVLYVCPRAHRAGHAPLAAVRESAALARAGARVCLLTFQGILDGAAPPNIPQRTVVPGWARFPLRVAGRFLDAMPKGSYVVCFLEQAATTVAGARLSRSSGYDVIYLRDADPFVFIPFVLSLFSRGRRWALSLAGTVGKGLYGSLPNRLIASPVIWGRVYRRAL